MEIMIARLVCPVRVGVGMAARKGAKGGEKARKGARIGAGGVARCGRGWRGAGEGGLRH